MYECCTLVAFPLNAVWIPSPKSTNTEVIALPVVGVAAIVKIVGLPTAGVCVDVARLTATGVLGVTVTDDETVTTAPEASVTVAIMSYVPDDEYTCETTDVPVTAPRSLV